MIARFRYRIGDIEQEDSEGQQDHHPDLYFLSWSAEEDGQQQDRRHERWQDDIHDVERVPASEVDMEGDVCKPLIWTAVKVKLSATNVSPVIT